MQLARRIAYLDVCIPHQGCNSNIRQDILKRTEKKKITKYMDMVRALHGTFHPLVIDTYGGIGELSLEFIKILSAQHDYAFSLSVSEILHRLQIMVHKGNAKILTQGIQKLTRFGPRRNQLRVNRR